MEQTHDFAGISDRDPTEVVELSVIEAEYLLLEANMSLATMPHRFNPPTAVCRDMSPFGR
jgi:hypothetical protein